MELSWWGLLRRCPMSRNLKKVIKGNLKKVIKSD
jgi:hypothetical protein